MLEAGAEWAARPAAELHGGASAFALARVTGDLECQIKLVVREGRLLA